MEEQTNTTVRKFPRTMQEAFPNDPQYASSIEVVRTKADLETLVFLACVFGLGFLAGYVLGKLT
ncbi:hypothetical protein EBT31_08550 [bacterium]|nr:hypothetical protein [bacterium]